MYCIECGQGQPVQEARFCPYCGTALHRRPSEASAVNASAEPRAGLTAEPIQATTAEPAAIPKPPTPAPANPGPPHAAPPAEPLSAPRLPIPVSRPVRVVPLGIRTHQSRQRLRWALAAVAVLLTVLAAAAGWWWWSQAHTPPPDPAIEIERLEPPAGKASEPAPTQPRP